MPNETTSHNPKHGGAYDLLRLIAASAVLFGHAYPLSGHEGDDPFLILTQHRMSAAELAVYIFFAISGYLVTKSWRRDASVPRFIGKRLLRIMPGLAFVIMLSVFLIGPLMTSATLADYFSSRETWTYLLKTLIYPAQLGLPDVFTQNPFPNVINGSLWSLRVEFSFYLLIAGLGCLGLLRRPLLLAIALASLTTTMLLTTIALPDSFAFAHQLIVFFTNAVPFFIAAALAGLDISARGLKFTTLAAVILTACTIGTAFFPPLMLVILPLIVIWVGEHGRCDLSRFGDFSYGIYLWGFIVQQMIAAFYPGIQPLMLFLLALAPSLLMGAISWRLVEAPALKLKPRAC